LNKFSGKWQREEDRILLKIELGESEFKLWLTRQTATEILSTNLDQLAVPSIMTSKKSVNKANKIDIPSLLKTEEPVLVRNLFIKVDKSVIKIKFLLANNTNFVFSMPFNSFIGFYNLINELQLKACWRVVPSFDLIDDSVSLYIH